MITISAPAGIGEVSAGSDLAELIDAAVARDHELGGLADGDVLVVTSKIVSKAEGLVVTADDRADVVAQESVEVVARRGGVRIARTRHGLVMAAAGVDSSNVGLGEVLPLPRDPDVSAASLRAALATRTGRRLGVIISDTSGRAWRIGQTDIAIGAAGVRAVDRYAGRTDPYGNELAVTAMVLADELAAAADLGKRKLTGRPVAVIRGLPEVVTETDESGEPARALVRAAAEDMFGRGTREAVLAALARALGMPQAYERWVELDGEELLAEVSEDAPGLGPEQADLVARLLTAAAYPG